MSDSISDESLLKHLAGRDEEAARRIFERYSRRLSELAQRHLNQNLAGRVDGEDVMQSAFRSFFERSARGEFQVDPSGDLWCLLVTITLNKVRRQGRFHRAEKRDVAAEKALESGDWAEEMLTKEPSQVEALMLVEQMKAILQGLPDVHAQILSLRLEGITRTEIAQRLNISRQSVHRALKMMQDRMHRLQSEDSSSSDPAN